MWHLYNLTGAIIQLALAVKDQDLHIHYEPPPAYTQADSNQPVLRRHDDWVYGREACLLYIDAVCPAPPLLPNEPFERARVWMLYEWLRDMPEEELQSVLPNLYAAIRQNGGMLVGQEPKLCDLALAERLLGQDRISAEWEKYVQKLLTRPKAFTTTESSDSIE